MKKNASSFQQINYIQENFYFSFVFLVSSFKTAIKKQGINWQIWESFCDAVINEPRLPTLDRHTSNLTSTGTAQKLRTWELESSWTT